MPIEGAKFNILYFGQSITEYVSKLQGDKYIFERIANKYEIPNFQ